MRRVVLSMHITLDGRLRAPEGRLGWAMTGDNDQIHRFFVASLAEVDAILLGANAYREMERYWPHADGDLARSMNRIAKVAFSQSLETTSWNNATIFRGDAVTEIARLKQESGRDMIVHGGASFAQHLTRAGVIDEFRLVTHPVAFGGGTPLFKDLAQPMRLELVESRSFDTGAALHIYRPR
jgi:dihydrofolate reductase